MVYWLNTDNSIENEQEALQNWAASFYNFYALIPFSIPCNFLLVVPRDAAWITHPDLVHPPIPRFVRPNTLDRGTPFEQAGEFGTACKVRMVPGVRVPEETFDRKGRVAARGGGEEREVSVFEFTGIMGCGIALVVNPDVVEGRGWEAECRSVEVFEPHAFHAVPNDGDLLWPVASEFFEAGDGEQ